MNINDNKIIELKEKIAKKKKSLGKVTRFSPVTNCIIDIDNVKHNIQVLDKSQLTLLLVKLASYEDVAISLSILGDCNINGFNISDWINDIRNRLAVIKYKEEENKLKAMEDKLTQLLSNEKKTELEIDEIEALLK